MTLNEYLTKQSESDTAFGQKVGLSQSQVSRLRRGISKPSWRTMEAIAAATKNRVSLRDWERSVEVTG